MPDEKITSRLDGAARARDWEKEGDGQEEQLVVRDDGAEERRRSRSADGEESTYFESESSLETLQRLYRRPSRERSSLSLPGDVPLPASSASSTHASEHAASIRIQVEDSRREKMDPESPGEGPAYPPPSPLASPPPNILLEEAPQPATYLPKSTLKLRYPTQTPTFPQRPPPSKVGPEELGTGNADETQRIAELVKELSRAFEQVTERKEREKQREEEKQKKEKEGKGKEREKAEPKRRRRMGQIEEEKWQENVREEEEKLRWASRRGKTRLEEKEYRFGGPSRPRRDSSPHLHDAADPIYFKDCVGREFKFPWQAAKDWNGMEVLIRRIFQYHPQLGPVMEMGFYELLGPDGKIIEPRRWEETIQPGWHIEQRLSYFAAAHRADETMDMPPLTPLPPLPSRGNAPLYTPEEERADIIYPPPPPARVRMPTSGKSRYDDMAPESPEQPIPLRRSRTKPQRIPLPYPSLPPWLGGSPRRAIKPRAGRATTPPRRVDTYADLVNRLSEHMPHLNHVKGEAARVDGAGKVTVWDLVRRPGASAAAWERHWRSFVVPLNEWVRSLVPRTKGEKQNIQGRVILVEDLSPSMIETLGSVFWLSPEFFEEHLCNSGYRDGKYADSHPRTWNTKAVAKSHVSLRWFRPLKRGASTIVTEGVAVDLLRVKTDDSDTDGGDRSDSESLDSTSDEKAAETLLIEQNIFRKEWVLSTDPDSINKGTETIVKTGWEERVTIYNITYPEYPVTIILLDPLPRLPPHPDDDDTSKIFAAGSLRNQVNINTMLSDAFGRGQRPPLHTLETFGNTITTANPTLQDLSLVFQEPNVIGFDHPGLQDPLATLLSIAVADTAALLDIISDALEEIGLGSTDDHLMHTRLNHWRALIARFQVELPELRQSLEHFHASLFPSTSDAIPPPPAAVRAALADVLANIDALIQQNEKSYQALRSDMALLESKRQIAEAESVGKLTELAFIFIPLTFVASLFSMQIRELSDADPLPSAWAFVLGCVLAVLLAYCVRLAIRSAVVVGCRRRLWARVREDAGIPPGGPIGTRVFLRGILAATVPWDLVPHLPGRWRGTRAFPMGVWSRSRSRWERQAGLRRRRWVRWVMAAAAVAVLSLPVVMVWVRTELDGAFKAMVTVVGVLAAVGVVGWIAWSLRSRGRRRRVWRR